MSNLSQLLLKPAAAAATADATTTTMASATTSYDPRDISSDDATWILTSTFIIFTMQSGFGLLESGCVNPRNEVNIMVKNVVDVVFGGVTYWMFGYAISFGEDPWSNWFVGWGEFFIDASVDVMGQKFTTFIFQMSFATTATTIVSGAMAERTKLTSYIVFSLFNTIIYCVPAHWMWGRKGFLFELGAIDIAGVGPVHLLGGITGLVATLLLKPRIGRFDEGKAAPPMGCPTNVMLGMFMLWWGWLGFNCGSTFGIRGGKWKLAARSAVATILSSMGGGLTSLTLTFILTHHKFDIGDIVNGILGALVSVTGMCALAHPWEAIVIGMTAGVLTTGTTRLVERLKIDDPVGVVPVHLVCGFWGLIAPALFVENDLLEQITRGRSGLFRGGGFYLLGVQLLAAVCIGVWSVLISLGQLLAIQKLMGLRVSPEEELLGADFCEHNIRPMGEILARVEPVEAAAAATPQDSGKEFANQRHQQQSQIMFTRTFSSDGPDGLKLRPPATHHALGNHSVLVGSVVAATPTLSSDERMSRVLGRLHLLDEARRIGEGLRPPALAMPPHPRQLHPRPPMAGTGGRENRAFHSVV